MLKLLSQQRFIACAVGCLLVLAASDASAQQRAGRQQQGGGQAGGGQAGGGQTGGIGAVGGTTQPSGAVTGEISRSADRVLSDGGAQNGAARGGMRGAGGMGGMGGMRGIGGMGGMRGGFGGMSPFGANPFGTANGAAQTPNVRTRLRAEIPSPARSPQMTNARVQRQFANGSPIARRVNGFNVSVADGVATVSGTAGSERDRRMAELVLRLEPGVRQINNQIVVSP